MPLKALRRVAVTASMAAIISCTDDALVTPSIPDQTPLLGMGPETWTYELLGNIGGAGGEYFEANAINDGGLIAGAGYDPTTKRDVAWRLVNGKFAKSAAFVRQAAGLSINSHGEVVGMWLSSGADYTSAMIWQFNGVGATMSGLPRHTADAVVVGSDINDQGEVVGWECVPFGDGTYCKREGLLWTPTKPAPLYFHTVSALGQIWGESSAMALNNGGDILGHTRDAFDMNRAWLMPNGGEVLLLPVVDNFDDTWPGISTMPGWRSACRNQAPCLAAS